MVNKDLIRRWVAALRSGEYQQGRHILHGTGRFCCLGVLCDIYGLGETTEQRIRQVTSSVCRVYNNPVLTEFAGLDKHVNVSEKGYELLEDVLINMNDMDFKSFEEIADYIEKELLSDG